MSSGIWGPEEPGLDAAEEQAAQDLRHRRGQIEGHMGALVRRRAASMFLFAAWIFLLVTRVFPGPTGTGIAGVVAAPCVVVGLLMLLAPRPWALVAYGVVCIVIALVYLVLTGAGVRTGISQIIGLVILALMALSAYGSFGQYSAYRKELRDLDPLGILRDAP